MRVLAMVHAYPPHHNAGAEMTLHAMLGALRAAGHEVHVLLSRKSPSDTDYDYEGVRVHLHRNDADPFPWFQRGPERADILLTHLENTPRASILGAMFKIPVVHVLHNNHIWTKRCLSRQPPQLAVFNTEWMAEDYRAYWDKSTTHPFPSTLTIWPAVDPTPYAHFPGTPGERVTLINLNEDKGADLFWALTGALPQRRFLGVRGAYGQQIVPERPPENVMVMGHQKPEHMRTVYLNTRILLMPSAYESYGRTAVEAMHCGIPVIAHPTPGLREALGDAGIFLDRRDIAGWVREINRLHDTRAWRKASAAVTARAAQLTPEKDLTEFVHAIERTVRRGTGFPG